MYIYLVNWKEIKEDTILSLRMVLINKTTPSHPSYMTLMVEEFLSYYIYIYNIVL